MTIYGWAARLPTLIYLLAFWGIAAWMSLDAGWRWRSPWLLVINVLFIFLVIRVLLARVSVSRTHVCYQGVLRSWKMPASAIRYVDLKESPVVGFRGSPPFIMLAFQDDGGRWHSTPMAAFIDTEVLKSRARKMFDMLGMKRPIQFADYSVSDGKVSPRRAQTDP